MKCRLLTWVALKHFWNRILNSSKISKPFWIAGSYRYLEVHFVLPALTRRFASFSKDDNFSTCCMINLISDEVAKSCNKKHRPTKTRVVRKRSEVLMIIFVAQPELYSLDMLLIFQHNLVKCRILFLLHHITPKPNKWNVEKFQMMSTRLQKELQFRPESSKRIRH